ncbi:ABC transporter permease [Phaeobacter gallaeciensis]|uniref:ABC transporter, inner membrane component n=1 Tax=Phaeobacter gallaeciensis TaxID=60890 RepID=A0AAD0ED62_9RHOB|nr:ABC transporter permease [Phaeobacter gallaeciensis]AHD11464.1 ABC-type dipeptide/oligopeptide/nickel transport system, permease component [Phaeobacter gallaeciensis DSM 26640]ATE94728.1 ABC transporter, inner membrane component [Phaeobacter gallaeciensis]ATE99000.1 ABC transporter, inner membrane component [Phaeobacter gallaeciensis]ATF03392.1 ABC transporter, inner membrane component [Phaeobacter gallaeciensis]ATF07772.1 ABC transporter, inner membrane component [Phaeobacter gallaeciensis
MTDATLQSPEATRPQQSRWQIALRKPGFMIGVAIIAVSTLLAIAPGLFAPYDPNFIDYNAVRQPPSWAHPFGTDMLGRDSLSRVISAYSVNMQMAVLATVFAMLIGVIIGALVGYYRGVADMIFGRVVDAVITFPFLVLVIAVVAVLGPGLVNMYIAITVVGWVYYARLMRAEVITQMGNDYASAGVVMGYSDRRVIFRHLLPNAITPVIVYWMTDMSLAILLGSSLGYLGLGAQPPQAEWGVLIAEGRNFITTAWWLSLMPGIAIVLTGIGFSLIGDGLADLLRPRG